MKTNQTPPQNIDEYIAGFPEEIQKILEKIRKTIRKAAPYAEEAISYQIPAYKLNGNLIFFAAYKNHIGLYPAPRGSDEFKDELAGYEGGKGTVQFPLDKPIPYDLIGRITKFRVKQNLEKASVKGKKK
ncbi:MAG: DUF1801 domain-containing protein [Acidobacteria bacterium]|nr:DUF1801 domain-containing protein [Acidobacteriota bacterium]